MDGWMDGWMDRWKKNSKSDSSPTTVKCQIKTIYIEWCRETMSYQGMNNFATNSNYSHRHETEKTSVSDGNRIV